MSDQLALFPESDAVTLPRKPWPVLVAPLGDAVDAPAVAVSTSTAATAPTLFDLDAQ